MDNTDSFKVSGRGELHLSVLIENMRREGYEFAVSKAEVLYHEDENGKKLSPWRPHTSMCRMSSPAWSLKSSAAQGRTSQYVAHERRVHPPEFSIPSRGLIGYRIRISIKGNGILNTSFDGYAPYKGDIQYRKQGLPHRF